MCQTSCKKTVKTLYICAEAGESFGWRGGTLSQTELGHEQML